MLGYPEAMPPTEALAEIQLVRGALQYGTQLEV
jgi:hypothetical protein